MDSSKLIELLANKEHVPHAFLVVGDAYADFSQTEHSLVRLLTCIGDQTSECVCNSCKRLAAHPDIISSPEEALNIDHVRDIRRSLATSPLLGKRRVALVRGWETARRDASDALLKSLEDTPGDNALILVAGPGMLSPTIRSRCMTIRVRSTAPAPGATNPTWLPQLMSSEQPLLDYAQQLRSHLYNQQTVTPTTYTHFRKFMAFTRSLQTTSYSALGFRLHLISSL